MEGKLGLELSELEAGWSQEELLVLLLRTCLRTAWELDTQLETLIVNTVQRSRSDA